MPRDDFSFSGYFTDRAMHKVWAWYMVVTVGTLQSPDSCFTNGQQLVFANQYTSNSPI